MNVTEEKKRSVPPAGEDRLIVQVKAGSSEAFAALAHRYIPLIKKLVGAAGVPPSERDDLTQEGLIGLLRAVGSYDNESSSFSTYASLCIKHSIISALRKYSRVSCVYLSDSPLELACSAGEESPEADLVDKENTKALYDTVSTILSPLEGRVLEMYLSGASYKVMASALSKEIKSIDNAVQRIKAKIKRAVSTDNTPW